MKRLCSHIHEYIKESIIKTIRGAQNSITVFFLQNFTSLCFLAELSPREPVEPLDEELPVVEQLLDI